jgi:hypothetical protein
VDRSEEDSPIEHPLDRGDSLFYQIETRQS